MDGCSPDMDEEAKKKHRSVLYRDYSFLQALIGKLHISYYVDK